MFKMINDDWFNLILVACTSSAVFGTGMIWKSIVFLMKVWDLLWKHTTLNLLKRIESINNLNNFKIWTCKSFQINIKINFRCCRLFSDPPEISVETPVVFSGEGQEAMLVCIVHGEAQPEVIIFHWLLVATHRVVKVQIQNSPNTNAICSKMERDGHCYTNLWGHKFFEFPWYKTNWHGIFWNRNICSNLHQFVVTLIFALTFIIVYHLLLFIARDLLCYFKKKIFQKRTIIYGSFEKEIDEAKTI